MASQIVLQILKCDNRIVATLNNDYTICDLHTDFNPDIDQNYNFSKNLKLGYNIVNVKCYNDRTSPPDQHNPWEFHYKILRLAKLGFNHEILVEIHESSHDVSQDSDKLVLNKDHTIMY